MSAMLDLWGWGRGCAWAAPDGGSGGASAGPSAKVDWEGLDAKEALTTLGDTSPGGNPYSDGADLQEFLSGQAEVTFPGPISEAFYWSDADVIGIQGPVGSGKTTTLLKSRLRRAIMMPRSTIDGWRRYKCVFARETYRQLWSTTIPSYLETFPKSWGDWSGGRGDPVTHVMQFEDAHGPIEFVSEFMAYGDNLIASMRGMQTTDLLLNEADTQAEETFGVGIGRMDRWPGRQHFAGLPRELTSYGQVACDFNAPDEENWTYKLFHDEAERAKILADVEDDEGNAAGGVRIEFYRQPGFGEAGCENLQNLGDKYYPRQIRSNIAIGRGDLNDRLVYNKITYLRAGEPVFKREFSPRIHVSERPLEVDPQLPLLVGLDQGFKGAAVVAQLRGFYRWRILAELHFPQERLMAQVFGQRLRDLLEDRFPGAWVEAGWGDMAGEHGSSTATDENATWNLLVGRAAGFHVRPQVVGTNRIQPRLEAVRAALEAPIEAGEPGILIDPSCRMLRRGFAARYVWADEVDPSGDKRKVPNKRFTEANVMDALQYLLLGQHRGDGLSPYASRLGDQRQDRAGGGVRRKPGQPDPGGLQTGWDVLNPYGN
ncbi:hypothetical protein SAMN05216376_111137 [Mameliella alba]|uniref:hypothetical protein n=2 Tax=Mameliella alba TaxID=561184 RepID=UPI0008920818|nr:hypothetical protein [Mameliella alba]PTR37287.1 hypothetical protein LX94_03626 [Mameliella alba]SDD76803.1 hypothetical protein SAMN05216376_111137 [Mameliella alba]